ncbi:ROK family protein [Mesorhizobium sp. M2A.F.Ca.ET.037.01.1.1]|uniref:ROK family protein n=1 Tax=unclassified Mesorhizobium TaxID=325217 RepID=UPI000F74CF88|nr:MULTISPECIES: ROK family protein [unclassified Mesorhizobium]RUX90698.1 ROK family protein [Mesorhizobium sp. M2A.F.Ca.ET.040.01.1.1]RVC68880.1 ROK family protein [Mesorhizobium sp. M00.F.Ca.ET.038.03.1.1]RVC71853.1 ROK family protein [Mesorhizobium sp. M2A.F.Ca.ET.046.02.1.1]AZO35780.1 ROK family protein [Mesorhizobium sp. M2A.F.Ca.ET.046.03.2.1]RUX21820.1 ROK family protein [Mesorhizobium sp. M2A.F.Ca.ET.037.01.1.1]
MAKAAKTAAKGSDPIVLSIDVGGSHVKILTSAGGEMRRFPSGPSLTPDQVVASVGKLAEGLTYDLISMGFPGPVRDNKPSLDPFNLGKGWDGYDFTASFGKPVKLVNDALMQAIGSYDGGRMLFLGLGTGLGAAMIIRNVGQPMELAHLPYKKGATFEDYVGERGLVKHGKKKWRKYVFDVVGRLRAALQPDYVVIGGGNVDKLDELPEKSRRGDNTRAFEGGFRLWCDKALIV